MAFKMSSGVIHEVIWYHPRGHMVSSEMLYDSVQEAEGCHARGHMISSKKSYGIVQEVMRCHPRGNMVSFWLKREAVSAKLMPRHVLGSFFHPAVETGTED